MFPSTLIGLLAFLVLLGPGFTYLRRRNRTRSFGEPTALSEILTIVSASLLCDLLAVGVFTVLRINFPLCTPDVGELVRTGVTYLKANYALLGWWVFGTYALAQLLAWLGGHPALRSTAGKLATLGFFERLLGVPEIRPVSALTQLTDLDRDSLVSVGCELDDGSWVGGNLFSFNPKPEETGDRSLVLSCPLQLRPPGHETALDVSEVGFYVISASRIVRLELTHMELSQDSDETGEVDVEMPETRQH